MVSDSSDDPPAATRRVAAEWLSPAERFNFQCVSHIVSFQFSVELARFSWEDV